MNSSLRTVRTLTATTLVSIAFAWGCNAPSGDPAASGSDPGVGPLSGQTGPSVDADYALLNKCLSPTAGVVGFSNTDVTFSGNCNVGGSVVLLGNSTLQMSGNANISGKIICPSNGQVRMSGNASGQVVDDDLSRNESAVLDFGANLDGLAGTQFFDNINSSVTIQGNGGLNVIQVNGDVNLAGNSTVTLKGNAQDLFLINVSGQVTISGNANVNVSGSLPAANVLFRLTGNSGNVALTGNGHVCGTFFAPHGSAQVSGNGVIEGSVFASDSIAITGNGLTFNPVPFCPGNYAPSPSPSPSPTNSDTGCGGGGGDGRGNPSPTPSSSATASPSPSPTSSTTATPSPSPTESSTPTPSPSPSSCTGPFCGGGVLGA